MLPWTAQGESDIVLWEHEREADVNDSKISGERYRHGVREVGMIVAGAALMKLRCRIP